MTHTDPNKRKLHYVVATTKSWNIDAFHKFSPLLPGTWTLITDPSELTAGKLEKLSPRYVFFPHWSWVLPKEVVERFDCVCFHMTDVPYGRGGSPLQNLISRGSETTKLSALKMVEELDAGPVYGKIEFPLSGSAQEIYEAVAELCYDLIEFIVKNEPDPKPQDGPVTLFSRRSPEQSKLPDQGSLETLYDHIRMLDADSYPHAFIEYGDFQIEFRDAKLFGGELVATVRIIDAEGESND